MLSVARYCTKVIEAYNVTRCGILRRQHFFTRNARIDLTRRNNNYLGEYRLFLFPKIASKYIAKPAYIDLLSGFVSNFALRSMYAGFAIKTQAYCGHRWHRICLEFLSEFDANLVTICYQIVYWGLRKDINVATRGCATKGNNKHEKIVGSWLLTCGGMVFIAVALGGITRLTESGLSMVTWRLLGEKMPLNETEWILEFERYQQYPEYKISNQNMTLEEFKRIWWMEYLHRMWGRLIGAVFIIPATYFWFNNMLKYGTKIRVVALGSLIGLQGLMGWYMVKSGLEDRFTELSDVPRVSQYRLAVHLGLALIIYTGFLYNALNHLIPAQRVYHNFSGNKVAHNMIKAIRRFKGLVHSTKGLIFFTALSGAFVAGMDAGLIYNTFPKMADKWIPDDIFAISPMLKNFTENPTTVQFDHRILGITTIALITYLGIVSRKHQLPGRGRKAIAAVLCAGYLQVLLGITTLLHQVPIALAACHQSGSLLLLSTIIWLCHELKHLGKIVK